ncbi:type VI secretion system-associated protein TagF [uncultured Litoreibacter sp.]|uniref:type VI secretion system-associated protein TagF n=1 Tax=uncultured Litoreibacter sp. TaxID=1392394 RepID=UPI0026083DE4|nr:type VI secretion system-associated protein TagF [uncultured Litoreibacter sp.]
MVDVAEPSAGFFGKHPAFGDFVGHGLSGAVQMALQDWLTGMLAQARAILGDDWQPVYDASRPIRFWAGSDVFNTQVLRGVICPSHDKVLRRYPFVLVQENAPVLPPVLDTDQTFHAGAEAFGAVALERTPERSVDIMATSSHDRKEDAALDSPMFWATNPDQDVAGLLGATASTDHARAAANRSYWWVAGTGIRASAMLSCEGPLQADGLAWLLRGTTNEEQITDPEKEGATSD